MRSSKSSFRKAQLARVRTFICHKVSSLWIKAFLRYLRGGGGGGTKYPPPLVGIGLARIQGLAHIQVSADEVKKAFCSVPKKTATGPERIYLSKRLDQMLGRCAPCSTSH